MLRPVGGRVGGNGNRWYMYDRMAVVVIVTSVSGTLGSRHLGFLRETARGGAMAPSQGRALPPSPSPSHPTGVRRRVLGFCSNGGLPTPPPSLQEKHW